LTVEQERGIANIGSRLGQLDSLAPVLGSLSLKMGNIETLLKQILVVLQSDAAGPTTQKKIQQRRSPG
jgi:hypothetical protein